MNKKGEKIRTLLEVPTEEMKSGQIRSKIERYIRNFRKNHKINLVLVKVNLTENVITFEFEGERISSIRNPFKKWIPKRLTIIKVLNDPQYLNEYVCKKEDQLYKKYGVRYEIKCVSQTQRTNEGLTLLILLATRK